MAAARGSAPLQYGRKAVPAPAGLGRLCSFTPVAASRSGRAAELRNMSQSFAAGSRKYSETVNADSLCWTPSINSKPSVCFENMPSEMLIKVFSYLDAVSLLHVACVNKLFYQLASDKGFDLVK
ncbi:F-box only protein 15-like [Meleagris gallopavo]|uniref:F-box only protein 15-like n=1 Tax=Meleagris gallopavo TaxID=9103 RepID=UPI000549C8E9|nr:F-box only protein 15-like [Meleagris gallopavo]